MHRFALLMALALLVSWQHYLPSDRKSGDCEAVNAVVNKGMISYAITVGNALTLLGPGSPLASWALLRSGPSSSSCCESPPSSWAFPTSSILLLGPLSPETGSGCRGFTTAFVKRNGAFPSACLVVQCSSSALTSERW